LTQDEHIFASPSGSLLFPPKEEESSKALHTRHRFFISEDVPVVFE
jgi:hypothetical protein